MSETISPELKALLRRLKLGPILATLPERLVLARQQGLSIPRVPGDRPGQRGGPARCRRRR
ncbi:MAG: hypothetical protein ACYDC2_13860, partial [Solirubrobacteraceae bacterium]